MAEIKSMTINGNRYDSFVDRTARSAIEALGEDQIRQVVEDYLTEHPVQGSGGVSSAAAGLLVEILRNGIYEADQGANITALQAALLSGEEVTYTVTYALTNVTAGSPASTVAANSPFTTALTAAEGYRLDGVTVTMGGVDVTAGTYAEGVVTIGAVTGHVVIVAEAVQEQGSTEVAMAARVDHLNASACGYYTDNGSTAYSDSKFPGTNLISSVSERVFEADTRLRITLTPAGNTFFCMLFCSTLMDGEKILKVDNQEDIAYYCESSGNVRQYSWSTAELVCEYTVRAGYKFGVFSIKAGALPTKVEVIG